MLEATALANRPYNVGVGGSAPSIEWLLIAAHTYAVLIEAAIGTPSRVVRCFEAWEKEMAVGIRGMTEKQIRDAGIWRQANAHALRVSKCLLNDEPEPEFSFWVKPRAGR